MGFLRRHENCKRFIHKTDAPNEFPNPQTNFAIFLKIFQILEKLVFNGLESFTNAYNSLAYDFRRTRLRINYCCTMYTLLHIDKNITQINKMFD